MVCCVKRHDWLPSELQAHGFHLSLALEQTTLNLYHFAGARVRLYKRYDLQKRIKKADSEESA